MPATAGFIYERGRNPCANHQRPSRFSPFRRRHRRERSPSEDKPGGTVKFVNQAGYLREIDLVGPRYDEVFSLLDGLEPHSRTSDMDQLRRGKPRKTRSAPGGGGGKRKETTAIRDWAHQNGIAVSGAGRLPGGVREKWEAAGRPGMEDVQS